MPRGVAADVGATRISQNGYHYTRTADGWRLTHHLVIEEKLDRPLDSTEMVRFIDGDKSNLAPANLEVIVKKQHSARARLAWIEVRIQELEAERRFLRKQLSLDSV